MEHVKQMLRVVRKRFDEGGASSPPSLDTRSLPIDFVCGGCGTLLMHAEEGQVQGVLIHCTQCGACNMTDG